jgi:hypothetical protein
VGSFPETFQWVLAVFKDDAAIGLIDTVIKVVGKLSAADGLADDAGDGCGGRSDQEPARQGEEIAKATKLIPGVFFVNAFGGLKTKPIFGVGSVRQ